ncbi:hypothetical protein [Halostagnicola bangensis]
MISRADWRLRARREAHRSSASGSDRSEQTAKRVKQAASWSYSSESDVKEMDSTGDGVSRAFASNASEDAGIRTTVVSLRFTP